MIKKECECSVNILRFDRRPPKWRINYCPKHEAVDDLYEALREIQDEGTRCLTNFPNEAVRQSYDIDKVDRIARNTLAKVEK